MPTIRGSATSGSHGAETTASDRPSDGDVGRTCSAPDIPITNLGAYASSTLVTCSACWVWGDCRATPPISRSRLAAEGVLRRDRRPGGGDSILGATFTFIWIDTATGEPTDIDGNGKATLLFREVYYNDDFTWNIDSSYDVETIAFHEAGHGLSQAHFGDIFIDAAVSMKLTLRAARP